MSPSSPPNHRFHEQYPDMSTGKMKADPLLSDEVFDNEKDAVFGKHWLCIGREVQVPNRGDYFVKEIPVAKASIIIIRDRSGKVNAFHNVCRHRSNKMMWEQSGTCRAMTCKFHGWSYKLDGSLADVPDEGRFFDFNKEEHGLIRVHLEIWRGFIFICLAETPAESLSQYLGEFGSYLADYPFEKYSQCFAYSAKFKCNWKVVTDAFQEAYHVAYVHGKSLVDYHHEPELGLFDAVKLHPRHATFNMPSAKEHRASRTEALGFQYSANIAAAISGAETDYGQDKKSWGFSGNRIFPNFFCDVLDGLYFTHEIIPVSRGETWYEHRMYFAKPETAGQRFGQEVSKIMLRDALLEDLSTLEHTQEAMEGGALKDIVLQDEEVVLRHFYETLDATLVKENFQPVYFPEK